MGESPVNMLYSVLFSCKSLPIMEVEKKKEVCDGRRLDGCGTHNNVVRWIILFQLSAKTGVIQWQVS